MNRHRYKFVLALLAAAAASSAMGGEQDPAAPAPTTAPDLTALSLEDLMNVEVTSVARQKQRVADAPAAVYVISREDIRRSGMSSLPDLLRMSPGMDVASVNANKWAVGTRGFTDLFTNKLLVLVDGRAVYRPLFSGVYWEFLDTVIDDVDRIEVIRGPGATLWGANAVNGVINITSRSARDTQGWLVSARGGNEQQVGALRYGGKLDDDTFYRVYAKYRHQDDAVFADESTANDYADLPQGGFRIDHYATESDVFTLQGDAHHFRGGTVLNLPFLAAPSNRTVEDTLKNEGANLLARWAHTVSDQSDYTVQVYYDYHDSEDVQLEYLENTFDIDFQHRFGLGERQEFVWGLGYRLISDDLDSTDFIGFDPGDRESYLLSAFVQDRITLVPDHWFLFLGSKFEQNSYTGFEAQPSARLLWTPDQRNSVWGAVSRAVRTPSRIEEDGKIVFGRDPDPTTGLPVEIVSQVNRGIRSEELVAMEAGYRVQATKQVSLDVAGFYNVYDHIRSGELAAPVLVTEPTPRLVVEFPIKNRISAVSYGGEMALNVHVSDGWRLAGAYSYLLIDSDNNDSSDPSSAREIETGSPQHTFNVRSYYDITKNLEFNAAIYYTDQRERGEVPPVLRLDANLVWRPRSGVELMIGVQNALDDRHPEFAGSLNEVGTEVQRAFYGQMTLTF